MMVRKNPVQKACHEKTGAIYQTDAVRHPRVFLAGTASVYTCMDKKYGWEEM